MLEKKIEEKLIQIVEKKKGWCIKFLPFVITGFPDRIVLLPGAIIFFVELKAPDKKNNLSARQKFVRRKLEGLGFQYRVVYSLETLEEFKTEISR